jgi:hypothetical protein
MAKEAAGAARFIVTGSGSARRFSASTAAALQSRQVST